MVFDIDDFRSELIEPLVPTIILHEMAHVLGMGTLQELSFFFPGSYDQFDCRINNDGRYNSLDASARKAYYFSKGYVPTELSTEFQPARVPPIETDFSTGTRCSHWDEATLDNELMTGFISEGRNPLSIITIGAMEDLGYVVSYAPADHYAVPAAPASPGAAARDAGARGARVDDNILHPEITRLRPDRTWARTR